jgi:hypothetical protein
MPLQILASGLVAAVVGPEELADLDLGPVREPRPCGAKLISHATRLAFPVGQEARVGDECPGSPAGLALRVEHVAKP